MSIFKIVSVIRSSRVKDVTLIKFLCPYCKEDHFTGLELPKECSSCRNSLSDIVLDFSKTDFRNIIAVPTHKLRKRISKRLIQELHKDQAGSCAYCDQALANYHVEHVIPLAAGGTNLKHNLVLACPECNFLASSLYFKSFFDKRAFVIGRRRQRVGLKARIKGSLKGMFIKLRGKK